MSRTFLTFFHHFPKKSHKKPTFFPSFDLGPRFWKPFDKIAFFSWCWEKVRSMAFSLRGHHIGTSWRWEIPPTGWNFSCLEENFGIPQLKSEFWRRMRDFYSLHEASFESIWKWRWGDFLKDPILLVLLVAGRTPATKTQSKPPRLKLRCHAFEGNYDFTKPFANVESQAH